jgi:hypothetical protein
MVISILKKNYPQQGSFSFEATHCYRTNNERKNSKQKWLIQPHQPQE